jgi:uncharacterized protein (DUF362 family)
MDWARIGSCLGGVRILFAIRGRVHGNARLAAATNGNHHGAHRYLVSNTVLDADVILNLPKLKTHMKTGMTGALKNFVGIIGSKDFLPHFRAPLIHGGGWHGNDTLWRTVHDLVDIARNYGVDGVLRDRPRTILTLVDAIVAGEDCGPLKPRPKPCGLLVWGEDPGMVDVACATLMGFDWRRIPMLGHLCDAEARVFSGFDGGLSLKAASAEIEERVRCGAGKFAAPVGWDGEIERASGMLAG